MYPIYLIATFALMGLSFYLQYKLKKVFKEYSTVPTVGGITGAEVAKKMLQDNGIYDVKIESVPGELTDHYNPLDKTVNLSPEVYSGNSVTAAAIAAHECGHAVQHAQAYTWLGLRSRLVPMLNFSASYTQWILMGGLLLSATPVGQVILGIGILLFAISTFFSFVTLPVEFDASARALVWLKTNNVTGLDHDKSETILRWAGMTYVVAAVGSLVNLLYYVMIFLRRRN